MKLSTLRIQMLLWLRTYYLALAAIIFILGIRRFQNLSPDLKPILEWGQGLLDVMPFQVLGLLASLSTVLLALLSSQLFISQSLRVLTFLSLFLFESLFNAIGSKTHLFQFFLWSSAALALMPSLQLQRRHSVQDTYQMARGIWAATSIILLFYSLSAFWKTLGLVQQIWRGEPNLLTTDGLIYHIYSEILRAGAHPILMRALEKNAWINPVLGLGVILTQAACLVGIVNTRWHRPLGYLLLFFHLGTYLILDITYPTNFLLVSVTLVLSPLRFKWKKLSF